MRCKSGAAGKTPAGELDVRLIRHVVTAMVLLAGTAAAAAAQPQDRLYAGALFGISTLSGDTRSLTAAPDARLSTYKPGNGPVLNVFAGIDVTRFVSAQANYVWNRNDVTLLSSFLSRSGGGFYEQRREGGQQAVVGDVLLYFRDGDSGIRPYLSTGIGILRFSSDGPRGTVESGLAAPEGEIGRTRIGLRVAVGIDLWLGRGWAVRYSFSETISGNPISPRLTPPGERNLANFDNLFGLVRRL